MSDTTGYPRVPGAGPDDLLSIRTSPVEVPDGVLALAVTGDVDMLSAPQLRQALAAHIETKPRRIVVDLTGVSFLGSSGLAALVESWKVASAGKVEMHVVAPDSRVLRPLRTTGLDRVLAVSPDVSSAIAEAE